MRDQGTYCRTTEKHTPLQSRQTVAAAWAVGGSVILAAVASACCWVPLVLLGLGVTASGLGSYFETYRPFLVGAAVFLLGLGSYFTFRHTSQYAPGVTCATQRCKLALFHQGMFWIAAALTVLLVLFPNYVGVAFGSSPSMAPVAGHDRPVGAQFLIGGMTCDACAARVQSALGEVHGVVSADVDYETKTAIVRFANVQSPSPLDIVKAIRAAGFRGSVAEETPQGMVAPGRKMTEAESQ